MADPQAPETFVIKEGRRRYHPEAYSADKLHKSIAKACLASGTPAGYADTIAQRVVADVELWLKNRPEVTSGDIRRAAAKNLRTYHPDASYLYEHHRSTL